MKKLLFALVGGGVFTLLIIQFIPVERSNPPVTADIPTSPEVKTVLKRACYDCHSNATVWKWYSRIAPVSWLLVWDVAKGREEINFSTWEQYSAKDQAEHIHESWEAVAEGEMPPWYYSVVHPEARLSSADRLLLRAWARVSPQLREEKDTGDNHKDRKD